jgi:hypothetical protein
MKKLLWIMALDLMRQKSKKIWTLSDHILKQFLVSEGKIST